MSKYIKKGLSFAFQQQCVEVISLNITIFRSLIAKLIPLTLGIISSSIPSRGLRSSLKSFHFLEANLFIVAFHVKRFEPKGEEDLLTHSHSLIENLFAVRPISGRASAV